MAPLEISEGGCKSGIHIVWVGFRNGTSSTEVGGIPAEAQEHFNSLQKLCTVYTTALTFFQETAEKQTNMVVIHQKEQGH